jgi:hypothetical protein
MVDFPSHPVEAAELAAFYRAKAEEAARRAHGAASPQIRLTFIQVADSYRNMALAIDDMSRKRASPGPDTTNQT